METQGLIISVLPEQRFNSAKGKIVKNSFVIERIENGYTQHLCFDVLGQEKWDKMKQCIAVGNEVQIQFNISSREYQGKWFTTASAFFAKKLNGVENRQSTATTTTKQNNTDDDMPF